MSEKIVNKNTSDQFKEDYIRYAIYITFRRVLSDYKDGLKPVQRRILTAALYDTKAINETVKSAAIVGDTMKKYHPHGNCKSGLTSILGLDGKYYTIEELYLKGIRQLDILAIDPLTGNVIPAVAHSFRIGQYTNKKYRLHFSNGFIDESTEEHPYMLADGSWIMTKNIKSNTRLYTKSIKAYKDHRPTIDDITIHSIVHDFYYGTPQPGYERHHIDCNFWNNKPDNIIAITKAEHLSIHNTEERYNRLIIGREYMFSENGKYREQIRNKNSILAQEFNKTQGIRRFKAAIDKLKERGIKITEENYESLRSEIYNLPIISRLIKKYPEYGSNFDELVYYVYNMLPTLSDKFKERENELDKYKIKEEKGLISPIIYDKASRKNIYKVFNRMLDAGVQLTVESYLKFITNPTKWVDTDKIAYLINLYKIECPYVEYVEIVDVNNEPMYDFTVNGIENMLIPIASQANRDLEQIIGIDIPLICIHNSGIEGTIKPMVNWFESYMPLMDKQGNFGSFQGDPAAAARYTECKLSKFSLDVLLGDLIETDNCVDWTPTYDDKNVEPEYLPVKIPLLLINGSFGIGLGLKSEIPSHNINEVIDATIQLIKDPTSDIILAPDHCMPCEIFDTDWKKICDTGFGHYTIRGVIDVEDYMGTKALIIKSIPNLTFLNTITDKIEEIIAEKKIVQIDKAFDESHIAGMSKGKKSSPANDKDVMRYVILLKPGADPEFVKEVIYKNTKMEQKLRVNLETLNGLNLMRMTYKSYLLSFIDSRKITKFRVYSNRLQDIQTKIHERETFIKALESGKIDDIINLIKKQTTATDSDLVDKICKMLNITDLQASYIINANLKRLSIGYLNKYKEEAKQFALIQQDILAHLTDPSLIEQEIIKELLDIKEKYGCPRRCKIIKKKSSESSIPRGEMLIIITEKNYIKKIPVNTPIGNFKNDSVKYIVRADNASNILIFDDMGRVFKLLVHNIPFSDKYSNGTDIRFLIKGLTSNICAVIEEDSIKNIIAINKNPKYMHSNQYIVVVSRMGLIKRMSLDDFVTIPPSGILYAKLDEGDSIKSIGLYNEFQDVIIYSDKKAIKLQVSEFPFLKRNTKGSRAMSNAGEIDGMCPISPSEIESDLIVITKSGKINRLHAESNLPTVVRGKNGFNLIKLNKGDSIHTVLTCNPNQIINVKTLNGIQKVSVNDIKYGSSISTGYSLISVRGDQIIRCFISNK